MSKWINKDLFDKYVEKKELEQDNNKKQFLKKSDIVWVNPAAGTATQPEIYEGRFLPDPDNVFTDKYHYHMWKSNDKWYYVFCPKTWDLGNYCPVCSLTNKLYMGTAKDKTIASNIKRKVRHVANFYIVSDKRDLKTQEAENKAEGKVKIYEFPDKVDAKIKLQLFDKTGEGLGSNIFDPGDDGHNFILRIKSTKADKNGKTYPDYSDSDFSRKSAAIGSDKQIKSIMETRYNLKEYIKGLESTPEHIAEILKAEMLYDLIKDEWEKNTPSLKSKPDTKNIQKTENVKEDDDVPPMEPEDSKEEPLSNDDEDLLKELENMK